MAGESEEDRAVIRGPKCSRDVSDEATVCPHCGHPLARPTHAQRSVQVFERTAKVWKAVLMLGWLLVAVGVVVLFADWARDDSGGVALGWGIAVAGALCLWIGKAGAWWYHG